MAAPAELYRRGVIIQESSPLLNFGCAVLLAFCGSTTLAQDSVSTRQAPSHLTAPTGLRCEGKVEPLAVAESAPSFSWLDGAIQGVQRVRQTSYEVRIARSEAALQTGGAALWDTGKQPGSTMRLPYAGPALETGKAYAWQVRVWDEKDNASPWSQAAHWTQAPAWRAQWIAADATDAAAGDKPMPLFRKELALKQGVRRALLHVSGLGQYEFRINGQKVGTDELTPGWSEYRKTVLYDSYDVTALLRNGENALGVLLGNGMYRVPKTPGRYTKFNGTFGPPKCIVQLDLEMADGTGRSIVSDASWKTHPGPITFSNTYGGEDFDARREPAGWDQVGFNVAGWTPALIVDGPGGALTRELAPPIRVMHTYATARPTEPKPGVLVYDLGQNFAGWPAISVSGPAGKTVKLIPGELLNADGTVSQNSSGEPQWFSYTLKGEGAEAWHPRFSYYGFRYVQVEGAAGGDSTRSDKPRLLSLKGEAVHTSSAQVGEFSSSDDLLNRIHTLIVRAIENNAVSLFTDCPHREKLGWLEETHLLASAMLYDFDFSGLYAATARNIADTQARDGASAGRIPEIAPQYVLFEPQWGIFDDSPEWGSAAVLAPWYVYQRDGDKDALLSHVDVMRRYVDYLGTRAKDNIIAYGLGDWYDIGPGEPGVSKLTTPGVTATATYYQDLRVLEKTLELDGQSEKSRAYGKKADAVRESFNSRFFDAAQHRYDKGSQTAQAMPLVAGLVEEDERPRVLAALVEDIRAHGNHVTAGDIGYHYVVEALLDGGRSDVLYDMLERTDTPSYGYQLAQGATALTEAWDADPNSSQDHFMLGHAEEWFYRGLGGIDIDFARSGTGQLTIHPQVVGKLSWVRTHYDSVWGLVESNWKRGDTQTEYDLLVPANATAHVSIDTRDAKTVQVNGQTPRDLQTSQANGRAEFELGSGRYHIVAADPVETR